MSTEPADFPDSVLLRVRAAGGWEYGDQAGFVGWAPWYEQAFWMAARHATATHRGLCVLDTAGVLVAHIPAPA